VKHLTLTFQQLEDATTVKEGQYVTYDSYTVPLLWDSPETVITPGTVVWVLITEIRSNLPQ
jgi:hypothetical protein